MRGARGGEELALADAAAGVGEEFVLRRVLDAFRDNLEVEAAGEGDQSAHEAGALAVVRHASAPAVRISRTAPAMIRSGARYAGRAIAQSSSVYAPARCR